MRRAVLLGGLALAAGIPLSLWFARPAFAPITAEKVQASSAIPLRSAEPLPAVVPPKQAPSERPPALAVKPRPPALSEEVAVLAGVRAALHAGDAKRALSVLNQHRVALQVGQLRLEAEVLRLEALSSLGAKQEVSERARRFIDENPNSPLVDRVRGYVAE